MIIFDEYFFLISIALVWIIGAIMQDIRRREVDNIWNFSLIGVALAYRFAFSVYTTNYWFFLNGVFGFFIFLAIANILYYSRVFAGGDAKLLIALGAILPLSFNWFTNLSIFSIFIIGFLLGGSLYVFIWAVVLVFVSWKSFKKEWAHQCKEYHYFFIGGFFTALVLTVFLYFVYLPFVFIGLIFLFFPILFVFAKAVEESCLVKSLPPEKITEGDWLYEDIFVNGQRIKASWEGLSKHQLQLIRAKYRRNIRIKQGIPFTPGFLVGFIIVLYVRSLLGIN